MKQLIIGADIARHKQMSQWKAKEKQGNIAQDHTDFPFAKENPTKAKDSAENQSQQNIIVQRKRRGRITQFISFGNITPEMEGLAVWINEKQKIDRTRDLQLARATVYV